MDLDPVALSRAQFALTVMFHYLFPPLSIGLGALMVLLEGAYLRTKDRRYEAAVRFFTKIFAVNFAVGVASGIVMEFQFGTNWATYSRFRGRVTWTSRTSTSSGTCCSACSSRATPSSTASTSGSASSTRS
jgi:cytochrome bd-type quinol oxidase subunit 1